MVAAALPTASYPALVGLVLLGSIIPVVPTGALVSAAAAAVVTRDTYASLAIVIVTATIGAFVGDVVTFALCRVVGERAVHWFRRDHGGQRRAERSPRSGARGDSPRFAAAEQRMVEHRVSVLVLARLVPAGRIPVLLAAGLSTISWRMFLGAQLIAGAIWAAMYTGIGLAGGTIFDEAWQAVLAALVIVVVLSVATQQIQKLVQRRRAKAEADAASGTAGESDNEVRADAGEH